MPVASSIPEQLNSSLWLRLSPMIVEAELDREVQLLDLLLSSLIDNLGSRAFQIYDRYQGFAADP